MTWAALLPLIIQYGVPVAEQLWKLFQSNTTPTQADWDALNALTTQTARTQMLAAMARNNIDPNSDMGKALLALS